MFKLTHIKLLLAFLALLFSGVNYAQMIGNKVLDIPEVLLNPTGFDIDKIKNSKVISGRIWRVFSDQNNNVSYIKPSKNANILQNTMGFMEEFYVVEMKGDYLRLVKDNNLSSNHTLSQEMIDYGWVKMENLLLSKHCMVTKTGHIDRKALLIDRGKYENKYGKTISNFYFVFKKDGESNLIGTSNRILPGQNPKKIIIGWISTEEIIEWNTRIVFEPNNDISAINERREKHIEPVLFINEKDAINYRNDKKIKENKRFDINNESRPSDKENIIGTWNRLPLLKQSDNIIELGFINNNSMLLDRGYTVLNVDHLGSPLYSQALLLSRLELGVLIDKIQELVVAPGSQQRQRIRNAWYELMKKQIGNVDEEELMNKTIEEVTRILFEIPTSNIGLKEIKLREITDKSAFPEEDFSQLVDMLQHKLDIIIIHLYNNDDYPYKFFTNNEVYYWVPEKLLL